MPEQREINPLPIFLPPDADYTKQTIALPGTERPGQTPIYRHSQFELVTLDTPGVFTNLLEVWDEGFRRSKGGPFLAHRPVLSRKPLKLANHYEWQSWTQVDARRRAIGSAVHRMFLDGELGGGDMDTVGIWSKNCPNWLIVDLALQAYGKVSVPLYDTLGADSVEHVTNHSELTIIFAAPEHIPHLLTVAPRLKTLKTIVSLECLSDEEKHVLSAWAKTQNLKVMDLAEVEELGNAKLLDVVPPRSDSIATISYTSGTSGVPKGVLLTHGNIATSVYSFLHGFEVQEDRTAMAFLPLAHIYERVMELCSVGTGKRIGYGSGDPLRFLEDIQLLKPHWVPLVPRVMNRLYQSIAAAGNTPGLKGALFRKAVATKLHNLRTSGKLTHPLWDRLVFRKVNAVLGGRLKVVGSGSAPLSADTVEFLKVALLADVCEGYGMTENAGICTICWVYDPSSAGTVGGLMPAAEVKLVDVPELGYRATDKPFPRGEVLMRGASRFVGYYKDPEKTKETIDEEGWLHTGDIATRDDHGRFKIIDRIKNIMKLAQGEYVALEHIENVYMACPLVAQFFIYGDSFKPHLVGIVVPDPVQAAALVLRVLGETLSPEDVEALERYLQDPRVVDAALAELESNANVQRLKGFEKAKRVYLTMDGFTVENNCLTPTLKVRRKEAYAKFKEQIDALYALLDPMTSKL
ncbi:acetyl-CoA synthetase-like protein [Trametes coccinea BRFM310]|uniref:Acetyl-CoA synthetase-like protein n=1 Tax=Trametes coccinea (strain BRFM310) TaxID=1353009 RepID=A0A1Y2J2C8_TRAC3|nr:acetyl-CoA synthetase-like protein [Trametes coccinea BRFM310]